MPKRIDEPTNLPEFLKRERALAGEIAELLRLDTDLRYRGVKTGAFPDDNRVYVNLDGHSYFVDVHDIRADVRDVSDAGDVKGGPDLRRLDE